MNYLDPQAYLGHGNVRVDTLVDTILSPTHQTQYYSSKNNKNKIKQTLFIILDLPDYHLQTNYWCQ